MDLPEFRLQISAILLPWKVFSYSSYSYCASAYIVLRFSAKISDIVLTPHANSCCITNFPDDVTNKGNLTLPRLFSASDMCRRSTSVSVRLQTRLQSLVN